MKKSFAVFDSIHNLSKWHWDKIQETNDYSYLNKDVNEQGKGEYPKFYALVWGEIVQENMDEFGLSDKYKSVLKKKKEYAVLLLKSAMHLADGDNSLSKRINMKAQFARVDLKKITDSFNGMTTNELKPRIDKMYGGVPQNLKTFTVYDWGCAVNSLNNG